MIERLENLDGEPQLFIQKKCLVISVRVKMFYRILSSHNQISRHDEDKKRKNTFLVFIPDFLQQRIAMMEKQTSRETGNDL
jgi:hypothetical protein